VRTSPIEREGAIDFGKKRPLPLQSFVVVALCDSAQIVPQFEGSGRLDWMRFPATRQSDSACLLPCGTMWLRR
jgi:hypothetical protein